MRFLPWFVALGVAVGCSPSPVPHSTGVVDEGGYDALPEEVREHFSEWDLENVVRAGVDIHIGSNPPDLSGYWNFDSMETWFYGEDPVSNPYPPKIGDPYGATWTVPFPASPGAPAISYLDRNSDQVFQEFDEVFLTGSDRDFTAFMIIWDVSALEGKVTTKRLAAWVFSGAVDESGLLNPKVVFYDSKLVEGVPSSFESHAFIEADTLGVRVDSVN